MKRMKFLFTAIAVFAVVGGAMALKTRGARNLYFCNAQEVCVLPTQAYSSIGIDPIDPPAEQLYSGTLGGDCSSGSTACTPYNGDVFIND